MSSAEDTEVFIPEQACVLTVPVRSLPASITRKMSACPVHSDQPATFISPVELREKGTTCKPPPLTPGQFFLPVVTSNYKAFKILREFLHSGENSLQFSDENSPAGSAFSKRKQHSIVLFNTQIFLIVKKAKAPDWPLELRTSTPSECEAPPLNSPVKMQDAGSDITEGRHEEFGAEDHGKCSEKRGGDEGDDVTECEAEDDDITDRMGSKDGAGSAEDHGKCVAVLEERERDVMKDREENDSHTSHTQDASTNTPSADVRIRGIKLEHESSASMKRADAQRLLANTEDCNGGESRITENPNPELTSERGSPHETRLASETRTGKEMSSSDHLKHAEETRSLQDDSSLAKAKCCKRLVFPSLMTGNEQNDKSEVKGEISELEIAAVNAEDRVSLAEDANEDVATSKPVSLTQLETSKGQRSRCVSPVEVIDLNDENQSEEHEKTTISTFNEVDHLLEKFAILRRKINDCINSQGSSVPWKKLKCDDIVMETGTEGGDLIIVESCAEIERVTAGSDTGVMEVDGSSTQQWNQHVNNDNVARSSAEAKGCESAVEIIDIDDDDDVLHKSTNQDATNSKSCCGAMSRLSQSPAVKHRVSPVEIVDLSDDDEVIAKDGKISNAHRRQNGDEANGCKRRMFDGVTDETDSAVAAGAQISDVNGPLAKRSKPDDDADFSSECKGLESAIDPDSRVNNYNRDVEIIEVDDDGEGDEVECCANERKVQGNRGNDEDSADKVSRREHHGGITDLRRRQGDGVESQSSLEKTESCERHVSRGDDTDDVESLAQAQIIKTEDSSARRCKSADVANPGGITREKCDKTQSSVGADDQDDLINDRTFSREADVEMAVVRDGDQVSRKRMGICAEPQMGDVTSSEVTFEHRQSVLERQPLDPDQDGEFVNQQSEATNQHTCGEAAGVLPRLTSPRASQEFDYMGLRREENINLMQAKLREMEEKLDSLRTHATDESAQER